MKVLGLNRLFAASVAASASLLASACYAQGRGTVDPPRIPPSRAVAITNVTVTKRNGYLLVQVLGICTSKGKDVYLDHCTAEPRPSDPRLPVPRAATVLVEADGVTTEVGNAYANEQGADVNDDVPVVFPSNWDEAGKTKTWSGSAAAHFTSAYGSVLTDGLRFRGYFEINDAFHRWYKDGMNASGTGC